MKFNESCSNCDEETEIDIEDVNRDGTFTCPKCGSKQLLCSMCGRKNCCSAEEKDCFRCAPCDAETMKHFDKFAYDVPHKDVLTGQDEGKMFGDFYTPYDVDKAMKAEGTEQVAKDSWNACLKAHGLEEDNKVKGLLEDEVNNFLMSKKSEEKENTDLEEIQKKYIDESRRMFVEDLKKIEEISCAVLKVGVRYGDYNNGYLYRKYPNENTEMFIRVDDDGLSYLMYKKSFHGEKELACVESYVSSGEVADKESEYIIKDFLLNEYNTEDIDKVVESVKESIVGKTKEVEEATADAINKYDYFYDRVPITDCQS